VDDMIRCDSPHIDALAKLSARALSNDPLYEYVFPDTATRETLAAWELGGIVHYGVRFGEAYAAPDLSGCAVWLPPGQTDFTQERMAEIGMWDSAARIGAGSEERLMRFITESEECHKEVAADLHWYLVLLAVDPTRQNEGIGSGLLTAGLERADAGGYPVYLEATNPLNVPFYRRRGFEVRLEALLSDGGPCIWYMVRDPVRRTA